MNTDQNIKISMIVPVFNGIIFLKKFIDVISISNKNMEIIFVDNGSTDKSFEFLLESASNNSLIKVLKYEKKQSSYAARNFGAKFAKGEIIAFTDIDCILTESYFKFVKNIKEFGSDILLTGPIEIFFKNKNIYEIFDKNTYLLQEQYAKNNYAATANLIVSQKIFKEVGGFPEFVSGGDNQFCKKCLKKGYNILFNNQLKVLHPPRDTYAEHIKKAKRLGNGHGESFINSNPSFISYVCMYLKQIMLIILPLNSARIFLRIKSNHTLGLRDALKIIYLCLAVNIYQRLEIIKTILRR